MERITARDIIRWTSGTLLTGEECVEITSVSTDSRSDCTGALFIPLKGENFDGHDFIGTAVEGGAVTVISEHENSGNDYPLGVAIVAGAWSNTDMRGSQLHRAQGTGSIPRQPYEECRP